MRSREAETLCRSRQNIAWNAPRQANPPAGGINSLGPVACPSPQSSASTGPRFLLGSLPSFMAEHILQIETSRLFVGAQKLAQGLKLTVPSPTLPQTKLSAPPRAAQPCPQRGSTVCQPHPATCDGTLCQVGRRRVATNQPVSLDSSALCAPRQLPWPPPLCLATSLQRSP